MIELKVGNEELPLWIPWSILIIFTVITFLVPLEFRIISFIILVGLFCL